MPAGLFERTKTTRVAMSSQVSRHPLRNLQAGRAVAVRIRPLPIRVELPADGIADPLRVRPREHVRSDLEGLRPLRVVSQRDARDAEETALLLEASGVRHDEGRVLLEDEHVEIPGRLDASQARLCRHARLEAEFPQSPRGSRVNREEDG